jgi:SAM-dependent methyltransferase
MAKRTPVSVFLATALLATSGCYEGRPDVVGGADQPVAPVTVELAPTQDPVVAAPHEPVWREFWFPIDNRERELGPVAPRILALADLRPGMAVADLGAGGGFYAFRMARLVGADGHVWAVDVDRRMTQKLAWEARARGVTNLTTLYVQRGTFGLSPRSVDLVTLIDTGALVSCYAERNARYIAQVAEALIPGGRFLFHDVLHDANNPAPGGASGCAAIGPDAMRALAASRFELLHEEQVSTGDVWRGYVQLYRLRGE